MLLCIHHKIIFPPVHSFGVDKVSRAYVNPSIPTQIPEEDKSVCNHQTETQPFVLCGLMSDLVICKFLKSMVIQDTECPY